MAQPIRNPGSAPIYRAVELLLQDCVEIAERTPKGVGVRTVAQRMVEVLLDTLTTIGLALNEMDYDSKYELLTSVFVQMRMVKTCIDTLKEWSSKSIHTRIISHRQMPLLCGKLDQMQNQLAKWRSSVVGKRPH